MSLTILIITIIFISSGYLLRTSKVVPEPCFVAKKVTWAAWYSWTAWHMPSTIPYPLCVFYHIILIAFLQVGKLRHRVCFVVGCFGFIFNNFLGDRVAKLGFKLRYVGSRACSFNHYAVVPSVALKVSLSESVWDWGRLLHIKDSVAFLANWIINCLSRSNFLKWKKPIKFAFIMSIIFLLEIFFIILLFILLKKNIFQW